MNMIILSELRLLIVVNTTALVASKSGPWRQQRRYLLEAATTELCGSRPELSGRKNGETSRKIQVCSNTTCGGLQITDGLSTLFTLLTSQNSVATAGCNTEHRHVYGVCGV